MTRPRRRRLDLALTCLLALAGCGEGGTATPPQGTIGLYSSLPIAWNESADLRGLLADEAPPHWALKTLRGRGRVIPLDTLADREGKLPLPADGVLVLAQPRPLMPQENVALDAWVRAGGRVLLFADPMLTAESLFGPGDPRRPQDIAMLSTILARWGLAQTFEFDQPTGERTVPLPEGDLPVNLPGVFAISGNAGDGVGKDGDVVARCHLEADGLLADCISGKGRILAISDAALLENPEDSGAVPLRRMILGGLLDRLSSSAGSGK
ncbi:MAG TPA: ABC transporter [Novosphingobium sp.]|nr:ABC transporter [Novosphingobium sp.]